MLYRSCPAIQERYALDKIGEEIFTKLSGKYKTEIASVKEQMAKVEFKLSNLDNFINYSIKLTSKLNVLWDSGSFELKQGVQTLVFPQGVAYDFENSTYRTYKSNTYIGSIAAAARVLEKEVSGTTGFYTSSSALVVPARIELASKV